MGAKDVLESVPLDDVRERLITIDGSTLVGHIKDFQSRVLSPPREEAPLDIKALSAEDKVLQLIEVSSDIFTEQTRTAQHAAALPAAMAAEVMRAKAEELREISIEVREDTLEAFELLSDAMTLLVEAEEKAKRGIELISELGGLCQETAGSIQQVHDSL